MIDAGQKAQASEEPLSLPTRILSDPQRGIAKIDDCFDLSSLFPNSPVFQNNNVARLQQELVHAIARLEQLPQELHDRDEKIEKKSKHIASISASLEGSEVRIERANQRFSRLMQTFEEQRDQIVKKSEHIARITGFLEEAQAQLQVTRDKFHKRADAMLAAATMLHEEVQNTQLGVPLKDYETAEDEPEQLVQDVTGQEEVVNDGVMQVEIEQEEPDSHQDN